MMNGKDIRNLTVYLYNVSIEEFATKIYQHQLEHIHEDSYIKEKYEKARCNTLYWLGELDEQHIQRVADAVSEKYGETFYE